MKDGIPNPHAEFRSLGRHSDGFGQPITKNVNDQWVEAEWRAKAERDIRKFGVCGIAKTLKVFRDVQAGTEKVRQHEDFTGAGSDTKPGAGRDGRVGEFQVTGDDELVVRLVTQTPGCFHQFLISFGAATAVRNQLDSDHRERVPEDSSLRLSRRAD